MAEEINFPRPPADITPKAYFSEWLPSQFTDFKDMIAEVGGDIDASVSVRVTGDAGGEWAIKLANGNVEVSDGLKDDSLVTVTISDKNMIEAVSGSRPEMPTDLSQVQEGGIPMIGGSNPIDAIANMKDKMDAIKNINGSVQFKIDDANPFAVTVKFAGPMTEEPSATLIVNSDTAKELTTGELNPQAAFMAGRLQIQGDMGLLMQLAQFMM